MKDITHLYWTVTGLMAAFIEKIDAPCRTRPRSRCAAGETRRELRTAGASHSRVHSRVGLRLNAV